MRFGIHRHTRPNRTRPFQSAEAARIAVGPDQDMNFMISYQCIFRASKTVPKMFNVVKSVIRCFYYVSEIKSPCTF